MRRLEHIRTLRNQTSRFQAKTPSGAVMVPAHGSDGLPPGFTEVTVRY